VELSRPLIRLAIKNVNKKEIPTTDKILQAVNDDPTLPNFKRTVLYETIKKLDFVFTKRKRCSVLTEREDLLAWRHNYLYVIRKYRKEGRCMYYLDETWLNARDCTDKMWVDKSVLSKHDAFNKGLTTGAKNPTGKAKRLIILHIGSEKGFLEGIMLYVLLLNAPQLQLCADHNTYSSIFSIQRRRKKEPHEDHCACAIFLI